MSRPDCVALMWGTAIPPRFTSHPYCIALLPIGLTVDQVGDPDQRVAGIFLVDPDCAGVALNDPAVDEYLKSKTPVFVFATRPRDLRPFLRRGEAFRRRGTTIEVMS